MLEFVILGVKQLYQHPKHNPGNRCFKWDEKQLTRGKEIVQMCYYRVEQILQVDVKVTLDDDVRIGWKVQDSLELEI